MADGASLWRERTVSTRDRAAPVRAFLSTESGSAGVLLAAAVTALVWANVFGPSYEDFWHTSLSIRLGDMQVSHDLRTWVNSGLMTFFFLVVGLEARRELDLGDLRERRRFVLPLVAGLAGMAVPAMIFLALNAGHSSAHGWAVAMSTDTALSLGLLALLGRDVPDRARVFLLTVCVVDDLAALVILAAVYTDDVGVRAPPHRCRSLRRAVGGIRATSRQPVCLRRTRLRHVGGPARQRCRPGRRGSGHRAGRPGVLARPRAARTGDPAGQVVP